MSKCQRCNQLRHPCLTESKAQTVCHVGLKHPSQWCVKATDGHLWWCIFFFTHAARWSLSLGVAAVRSNSVLWGGFSKTISLQGYKGWMKSQGVASIMLRPKIPFWGSFTVKISSVIFHNRFVSVCPSCLSVGSVLIRWGHIVLADVTLGRKPALCELSNSTTVVKSAWKEAARW